MKEYHIVATLPTSPRECSKDIRPGYGWATLCLTPYGEYKLSTYGITDSAVRRSPEYRSAVASVSLDMFRAYEGHNLNYTTLHKRLPRVKTLSAFNDELASMKPRRYTRATFALSQPSREDIEKDLENEAKHLNYGMAIGEAEEKAFVSGRTNRALEARQQAWHEGQELFCKIENAREARENARFMTEWKTATEKKRRHIEGREEDVDAALHTLCNDKLHTPYNLTLACDYDRAQGLLTADLMLDDGIAIPTMRCSLLASRRVSIKNKTLKDSAADRTTSVLGLTYLVAAHLFGLTPNIRLLRLALYARDRRTPLLWVGMDRDTMARVRPETLAPIVDILGFPHVVDFRTRGGNPELVAISPTLFFARVDDTIRLSAPQDTTPGADVAVVSHGQMFVSLAEAERLSTIPAARDDAKRAIAAAHDTGSLAVWIDRKYEGILAEMRTAP